jgi:TolA-binding protein
MNNSPENLSPIVRLACALVRCNPDLLALSPRQDRYAVVSEALLLSVVAGVTGLAWTAFWAQFVTLPAALAFGALASVFMFLIDQAIGAADWRLTGVLRQPGARRRWWEHGRLAMRLAMTVVLSTATSTGASMAMFHDAIRTQLEQDVRGKNRQIEEQYAERLREQRTLRFGTLEAEVQRLTTSAGEMNRVLDAARQLRATASQRAEAYGIETDRELKGAPGYKAGAGSQYREALARKTAADADLAKAASDISIYEPRMAEAQKKLDKASADVRAAEAAFAGEAAQIDEERKSHLIPDRNDALMSYLALEEVYSDPRFGSAARHFSWLMMAVLMTFELSYVVVRAWFTHASVYMAILIGDTKKRADRVAADYESSRDALRRTPDATVQIGRAPLRFLPAPSSSVAAIGEAREVGARNPPLRKST